MLLRKHQQGLGMLGWLIVLAIASFLLTCFFKVGPIYLEYWQAKQALDLVMSNPSSSSMSSDALRTAIRKQLEVSTVDVIQEKDIKITDSRGERQLSANYEKRVPLIYNIDVVVKFDKLVYKLSAAQ